MDYICHIIILFSSDGTNNNYITKDSLQNPNLFHRNVSYFQQQFSPTTQPLLQKTTTTQELQQTSTQKLCILCKMNHSIFTDV